MVLLDDGNNLAFLLFHGKVIDHSDRAEVNLVSTTVCGLLRGQGHEDTFREVDTDIYMAVGTMCDTHHRQRHAVDTDGVAERFFVVGKQHVGHMFTNDAHLTMLVHINVVDETSGSDPLWNQIDKLGVNARHHVLVTLVTPDNILVTCKVNWANRLHHAPEALSNQLFVARIQFPPAPPSKPLIGHRGFMLMNEHFVGRQALHLVDHAVAKSRADAQE